MKLSIVIVSWNVREDLAKCLKSIEETLLPGETEVIVIDNSSSDGTAASVRKSFPDVNLIANKQNRGFAAANNQGIKISQGQYILLLNPDTIVQENSLATLVKFMDENKDVGICGPKLLNKDGTIQPSARSFPTFRGALYRHTAFRFVRLFRGEYKKWLMKDFNHTTLKDVDQVMGAALMVRRSAMEEAGAMDESFFMYYEEVDLCYRIKQTGQRVVFVPESVITHSGGKSAEQIPVEKRIMMLASLLKFFRKNRGKFPTMLFGCIFKPAVVLRDIINIISGTFMYVVSAVTFDGKRRKKSATQTKNSLLLVARHSWRILFKM